MKFFYFIIIFIAILLYIFVKDKNKIYDSKKKEANKILSSLEIESNTFIKDYENNISIDDFGIFSKEPNGNNANLDKQPEVQDKDSTGIAAGNKNITKNNNIVPSRKTQIEDGKSIPLDYNSIFENVGEDVGEEDENGDGVAVVQHLDIEEIGSENEVGEGVALDYSTTFKDVGEDDAYGDGIAVTQKLEIEEIGSENEEGEGVALDHRISFEDIADEVENEGNISPDINN